MAAGISRKSMLARGRARLQKLSLAVGGVILRADRKTGLPYRVVVRGLMFQVRPIHASNGESYGALIAYPAEGGIMVARKELGVSDVEFANTLIG